MIHRHLNPDVARERLVRTLRSKGITDEAVLDAFKKVPRHMFVDGAMYAQAYDDNALPIGMGQTISQPYIVALMTQLLKLKHNEKILEIGTGSGFQAAILAQFSRRVYTVERNHALSERARKLLRGMGYENVVFKVGDGTKGWPQHAPFDKIIVTAGGPAVPQQLEKQLADDGRMVIPIGGRDVQSLEVYVKSRGVVRKQSACDVVFVPLIGEDGWSERP